MKRIILFAPLALFIVLGAYFAVGLQRDPGRIPSALIDRPLPVFDLPPIEGADKGFSSSDLAGRVALVNIFGSWCASCLIEHPALMEISRTESVILAGLDWKDPNGGGRRWLDLHGNPYDFVGDDADGRVAIDFGVTGAPETFIIDRNGRIRHKHVGPISMRIWRKELKPLVEMLESEDSGA